MSLKQLMCVSVSTALLLGFSAVTSALGQKDNLSVPLFPDFDSWKVGFTKRAKDAEIIEWVQKTETVDRWTKLVTIQKFKVKQIDVERSSVLLLDEATQQEVLIETEKGGDW